MSGGGWAKRDPVQNMVFLGDGDDDRKVVGGLLVDITQNKLYPTKMDYSLIQKSGEVLVLGGSASLGRQIGPTDVGKFVKCAFTGWGKSANGKFKQIEVNIWEGDVTPEMKAWPKYADAQRAASGAAPRATKAAPAPAAAELPDEFDGFSADGAEDDGSLPF